MRHAQGHRFRGDSPALFRAEGSSPRFHIVSDYALQWGRRFSVPEALRGNVAAKFGASLQPQALSWPLLLAPSSSSSFATMVYLLPHALREFGLAGTEIQNAQAGTICSKLLKIGATVQVSVRRIVIHLSESYPYQHLFERVLRNLRRQQPQPLRF